MPNETTTEVVKYQWIKGDDQGTLETYVDTDGKFLVFESGRRCAKNLIGKFIQKIDFENPALEFDDPLLKTPKSKKPKPGEVAAKAVEIAKNMKSLREAVNQSRQPLPESPTIAIIQKAKLAIRN